MSMSAEDARPSGDGPEPAHDSDAGLQDELRREAAERAAFGGDASTNRNLSGSTTWVTLGEADSAPPDQPDAPDGRGGASAP